MFPRRRVFVGREEGCATRPAAPPGRARADHRARQRWCLGWAGRPPGGRAGGTSGGRPRPGQSPVAVGVQGGRARAAASCPSSRCSPGAPAGLPGSSGSPPWSRAMTWSTLKLRGRATRRRGRSTPGTIVLLPRHGRTTDGAAGESHPHGRRCRSPPTRLPPQWQPRLLLDELDSTLTLLSRDDGRWRPTATVPTRGPGAAGDSLAAAVALSPSGRIVVASNRATTRWPCSPSTRPSRRCSCDGPSCCAAGRRGRWRSPPTGASCWPPRRTMM